MRCDDCTQDPCVCDPRLKWLNEQLEKGPITIMHTEDGDVGLWVGAWDDRTKALAVGDTVEDLLNTAWGGQLKSALEEIRKAGEVSQATLDSRVVI